MLQAGRIIAVCFGVMNDGHGMGVQVFEYLNVLFHKGGGKMVAKGEPAACEMPMHRSRQLCVVTVVADGYPDELFKPGWIGQMNSMCL